MKLTNFVKTYELKDLEFNELQGSTYEGSDITLTFLSFSGTLPTNQDRILLSRKAAEQLAADPKAQLTFEVLEDEANMANAFIIRT